MAKFRVFAIKHIKRKCFVEKGSDRLVNEPLDKWDFNNVTFPTYIRAKKHIDWIEEWSKTPNAGPKVNLNPALLKIVELEIVVKELGVG